MEALPVPIVHFYFGLSFKLAKVNFSWSCTRWSTTDSDSYNPVVFIFWTGMRWMTTENRDLVKAYLVPIRRIGC